MVGSSASAFRTWDSERAPAATLEATQDVQALSLSTTSEGTTPRQSLANTRILRALESRDQPEGRLSREVAQAEGPYGIRMETQPLGDWHTSAQEGLHDSTHGHGRGPGQRRYARTRRRRGGRHAQQLSRIPRRTGPRFVCPVGHDGDRRQCEHRAFDLEVDAAWRRPHRLPDRQCWNRLYRRGEWGLLRDQRGDRGHEVAQSAADL